MRTIITTKAELEALPAGSIVTSPFPDMESNVAERTSDGHWLITGETYLNSTFDLFDSADSPFVVVRHGYDDVMTDARDRVRSRAQALLDKYDNTPVYSAEQLSTNPLLQDELLAAGEVVDALRELLERI